MLGNRILKDLSRLGEGADGLCAKTKIVDNEVNFILNLHSFERSIFFTIFCFVFVQTLFTDIYLHYCNATQLTPDVNGTDSVNTTASPTAFYTCDPYFEANELMTIQGIPGLASGVITSE